MEVEFSGGQEGGHDLPTDADRIPILVHDHRREWVRCWTRSGRHLRAKPYARLINLVEALQQSSIIS